jgi:hypothetical protein
MIHESNLQKTKKATFYGNDPPIDKLWSHGWQRIRKNGKLSRFDSFDVWKN